MTRSISIDAPLAASGATYLLLLDPRTGSVDTYSGIGPGVPAEVWHGVVRSFALPASSVPEAIEAWLKAEGEAYLDDIFVAIKADNEPAIDHAEEALREALEGANLPTYWDAADWLSAGDWSDLRIEAASTLGSLVREHVEAARIDGAHLRADDVREYLVERIEGRIEAIEDGDEDGDSAALGALLAGVR